MGETQKLLLDKAKSLPELAGCYLLKKVDLRSETVLYVGKAKNLKSRVCSYFNNSLKNPKTEILVSHVNELDFIITENETEAFVLENNLIKKYSPKYNIRLKDDRSYPYVMIEQQENFSRLLYKRNIKFSEGKNFFGPFVVGSNIREVVRVLTKTFQLRDCSNKEFAGRKRPCLLYQMKQCSAPCVQKISREDYARDLKMVVNFFTGNAKESLEILHDKMMKAAQREEFETAAMLRDNLVILQNFVDFSQQKNAEFEHNENIDIIAYHQGEIEIDISLYLVRRGILLGHKSFHFPILDCTNELEDEVVKYIFQYYQNSCDLLPERIVTCFNQDRNALLSAALLKSLKRNFKVHTARKKFSSLMSLTLQHAIEGQRVRIFNEDSVYLGLDKLKDLLGLKERPVILECYDVAIWQGHSPSASQIVYIDGRASKKFYRYYHLKTLPEGNNDFAMMKEVLERRLEKGNYPDVFIVDGGKGQLSVFEGVLKDFGIEIPVVAIAKAKTKNSFQDESLSRTEERLFLPGRSNPYLLKKNKSLLKIIVSMRDEAHRFSRKLHHVKEKGRVISSWADGVKGIGPKTKDKILKKIDVPLHVLQNMTVLQLQSYFGISATQSESLHRHLESSFPQSRE